MKRGWLVLVASVGVVSSGCSDDSNPAGNDGGDASVTNDAGDAAPNDAATADAGDAQTGFGGATPLTAGAAPTAGTLGSASDVKYYSFTGVAGHRVEIQAIAQGLVKTTGHDPFDPTVTDTVVTLYLPDQSTVWASDNDGWPRASTDSTLFAELPSSGTFYVTVEDCNAYAAAGHTVSCAPANGITDFAYQVSLADLTAAGAETVGNASSAQTLTYSVPNGNPAGDYGDVVLAGDVAGATDVQSFSFTPPTDVLIAQGARARAAFWVQPIGPVDGDGTAIDVVLTAKHGSQVIAQADQQHFDNGDDATNGPLALSFPLDGLLGTPLTLDVTLSSATPLAATKSYYVVEHRVGTVERGMPEGEGPSGFGQNDTVFTAESVAAVPNAPNRFEVDGNLSSAADTDWYSMTLPNGVTQAALRCEAARNGSGLVGFTATLFNPTGLTQIVKLGPEAQPATTDLAASGAALNGVTSVTLKITATALQANNAGTFYHCAVAVK